MKNESNSVTTNQTGIHKDLNKILDRNKLFEFKKPFTDFSINTFNEILSWIEKNPNKEIVLDMCCGVGESTFHLSKKYKDCLVIGIDKSLDRIDRNNDFKKNSPENMLLVRGDLIDLWRLFSSHKNQLKIKKQYILYPNPYPKQKHLKMRWHGHAVFPFILSLGVEVELRSNWKLYLEEFQYAAEQFGFRKDIKVDIFVPECLITPFERKFHNSNQDLYSLNIKPQ